MRYPRFINIFIFIVCFSGLSTAQVDYSAYETVLTKNVSSSGIVDYSSIIKNDKEVLNKFLKHLSSIDPEQLSKDHQLAFWINAYNAYTIKLIIDHWPVKSIMDIYNGKPWDEKWISINGKTYSLNQIENDVIRPRFQDPRIHFAVNCAAISCPPLYNRPFTGDQIDKILEERTTAFINDRKNNYLSGGIVKISKIFEWYKSDFGDVIAFINKYANTSIKPNATISYTSYNWALNN